MNPSVCSFELRRNGFIPNNPELSVLVYDAVIPAADAEDFCRARLKANGWGNVWIDGVYDYHHYHSTTHEFLGVLAGRATLVLGGEGARRVVVFAGDALVLPAGTGHQCLEASDDFSVLGAYPAGAEYDMKYGREEEWPQVLRTISAVPLPAADPFFGPEGPLLSHWK